jgi:hypothetical protein
MCHIAHTAEPYQRPRVRTDCNGNLGERSADGYFVAFLRGWQPMLVSTDQRAGDDLLHESRLVVRSSRFSRCVRGVAGNPERHLCQSSPTALPKEAPNVAASEWVSLPPVGHGHECANQEAMPRR